MADFDFDVLIKNQFEKKIKAKFLKLKNVRSIMPRI